ncbi:MAG: carbamoyltransferase HypF, partial [Halopseudomonas sp.]
VGVTPDATVCPDCLNELFNYSDRRYRYPFINCTNCGPRYSLIRQLPYDRPHTTMAAFSLCDSCNNEYSNSANRRFHAQPNACADCGPQLRLHRLDGGEIDTPDPIAETLSRIEQGQIIAIKGIGGFHLVCDAANEQAVAELRRRKQRDQKPFALMAANPASLRPWVELNSSRIAALQSLVAPIVLCPAIDPQALPGIAPKLEWIGVMLPHSPLHYLLFHQHAGQPEGCDWLAEAHELLLVMTSANPSGEPLVTDNAEAFKRLGGLADAILLHDREIHIRCDDSVVHGGSVGQTGADSSKTPALIRRGRGLAPQVIALPAEWSEMPSVLATGALLKNTVCLTKGNRAYVSQHIGDLDKVSCCRALESTVEHLCRLFDITPQWVVHDLHPDNFASQFGQRYAQQHELPVMAVQHHHAHIAAVIAEHSAESTISERQQALLGLALDGFGLGDDGTLWGGELLRLQGASFERLGRFSSLALPGGDRAAREPWRMAASALFALGRSDEIESRYGDQAGAATIAQMLQRNINSPPTSSAGRLFDAVAGILAIQPLADYEAQPAMMLEGLAQRYLVEHAWPDEVELIVISTAGELDALPLLARLFELHDQGHALGYCAALLHAQLIDALVRWVEHHNRQAQLQTVVLAGGCFLNQLLSDGVERRLQQQGLNVLRANRLPCNDGGLSLGQAWLAMMQHDEVGSR